MSQFARVLEPGLFARTFESLFNSGSLDAVASLYTDASVLHLGGVNVLRGLHAIRTGLGTFLAPRLPIAVTPRFHSAAGGTAVVAFDWIIDGVGPDGNPFRLGGRAFDVLARQEDGSWRQLLDQPFGAETLSEDG